MVGTPLQRRGLDMLSSYRKTYTPDTRFLSHDIALVLEPISGLIILCAGDVRSEPFTAVGEAVLVEGVYGVHDSVNPDEPEVVPDRLELDSVSRVLANILTLVIVDLGISASLL